MPHHTSESSHHPLPGDEPLTDEQRINAAIAYMNEAALKAAQLFGIAVIVPEAVGANHTEEPSGRDTEDTAMVSLFFGRLSFLKSIDSIDSAGLFAPLTPRDADLLKEAAHMSHYPTRVGRLCFAGSRFYVYRGFDRVENALLVQDAFSRQLLRFKKSLRQDGHPEPDKMGGVTLSTLSGQVGRDLGGLRLLSSSDDFTIRTLMQVAGRAYFTPEGTSHHNNTRHLMLKAEAGPLSQAIALTPDFHAMPPWDLDRWLRADYMPKKVKPEAGSPLKPVRTETTITEDVEGNRTVETREVAEDEGERPLPTTSASPHVLGWDLAAPGGDLSVGMVATRNADGTVSLDIESGRDIMFAPRRTADLPPVDELNIINPPWGFEGTLTGRMRSGTPNAGSRPRTGTVGLTQETVDLASLRGIENSIANAVFHPSVWFVVNLPDRVAQGWRVNRSVAAQDAGVAGQPWRIIECDRWALMRVGFRLYPLRPSDTHNNPNNPRAMQGNSDVMPRYSVRINHGPDDQQPLFFFSSADMDAYTDSLPQVDYVYTSMSYERMHTLALECEQDPNSPTARAVFNAFEFYINRRREAGDAPVRPPRPNAPVDMAEAELRTIARMTPTDQIIMEHAQGSRFSEGVWRTWITALSHLPMTPDEIGRMITAWEAQGMHQDPISQAIGALARVFEDTNPTPTTLGPLAAEYNSRVLQRHIVAPPGVTPVRGLIENGVITGYVPRPAMDARPREGHVGRSPSAVEDDGEEADNSDPEEDSSDLPAGVFLLGGGPVEVHEGAGLVTGVEGERPDNANPGTPLAGLLRAAGFTQDVADRASISTALDTVPRGTFQLNEVGGVPVLTGSFPLRGPTRVASMLDEIHPPIPLETVTLTAGANLPYEVMTYEPMTERQAAEATQRLVGFGFTDDAAEDAADALSDNYGNPAGLLEDLARVEEARDLGNVTNEQIREAVCADMTADDLSEYEVGPWTQFLDENGLIPFPQEHLHAGAQEAAEALPGGRSPVTPQTQDPAHRAALSDLVDAAGRAMAYLGEGALRTFGNVLSDVLESDAGGWASGQTCPNCGDGTLMVHHGDGGTIVECHECHRDPRRGPADLEAEIRAAGQRLADRLADQAHTRSPVIVSVCPNCHQPGYCGCGWGR